MYLHSNIQRVFDNRELTRVIGQKLGDPRLVKNQFNQICFSAIEKHGVFSHDELVLVSRITRNSIVEFNKKPEPMMYLLPDCPMPATCCRVCFPDELERCGQTADDSNPVAAQITAGKQATTVQEETGKGLVATGIVFVDANVDGKFGDGDLPFAGIKVSNGKDITTTDIRGRYQLPITEDSIIFLIKPTGYRTAT